MQKGLTTQNRHEIAEALRFQQSLLRLGAIGHGNSPKKPATRSAEPQARQLAVWADQLGLTRAAS